MDWTQCFSGYLNAKLVSYSVQILLLNLVKGLRESVYSPLLFEHNVQYVAVK